MKNIKYSRKYSMICRHFAIFNNSIKNTFVIQITWKYISIATTEKLYTTGNK